MCVLRSVLVSLALLSASVAAHAKPPVSAAGAASEAGAASAARPASAASEPKVAAAPASGASVPNAAPPPASAASAVDPLAASLTALTQSLSTYLLALAGTSALVVALLEAYKKLFSVRGKYHRTAVMRWLAQDASSIKGALSVAKPGVLSVVALGGGDHFDVPGTRAAHETKTGDEYNPEMAYAEFFHLTSGQAMPSEPHPSDAVVRWRGIDRAVFELETARMMSQIQDAADAVLNNPTLYPNLYAFLTRGATPADSSGWLHYISAPPPTGPTKLDSDRYGRIKMLVKRQLDSFQTVTTCRWEDLNQWWAMVAGAVLLFIALVIGADPDFQKLAFDPWRSFCAGWGKVKLSLTAADKDAAPLVGLLLKAALGGVLAPLAKDLLNSISTIKFSK